VSLPPDGDTVLVLRTANTAPVWRGGAVVLTEHTILQRGYVFPPSCTRQSVVEVADMLGMPAPSPALQRV
jgi:hypothetical protein